MGRTEPIGRKSSGTIAYKNSDLNLEPLLDKEIGLLNTKAGIAYYDPEMNFSDDEISKYRENLVLLSDKIPTSKYISMLKK